MWSVTLKGLNIFDFLHVCRFVSSLAVNRYFNVHISWNPYDIQWISTF